MKSAINEIARKAGFFAAGVASVKPLDELDNLTRWIAKGFAADMHWFKRNPLSRCNPVSLLPSAKSVICCALAYDEIPPSPLFQRGVRGDLNKARFARGPDYHKVVRHKLDQLWNMIKKYVPDAHAKFCVDTSPVLEKALAVRAGIGWQGKNSVIINKKYGSFFVLGEIITDIKIEEDSPHADMCGNCTRCIDACPTGAIVAPHVVSAGRCLSYWTIENAGQISTEIAKHLTINQYGCDICQEVCPFNEHS